MRDPQKLIFCKTVPAKVFKQKETFFFVDKFFQNKEPFKSHDRVKFLRAGEKLKTFQALEKNIKVLIKNNLGKKSCLVAVGGGSVGDSVGFLASVYLRGVDCIQMPTTWLAAIDSSLGGKTALNFGTYKNQVGSFYMPKETYLCESLITTSSLKDAEGEILKTLLLNHQENWAQKIIQRWKEHKRDLKFSELKSFVEYKNQVVQSDPYDDQGKRVLLNLGHTLAHAFELSLGHSHGRAVELGLLFSLNWAKHRRYISVKDFEQVKSLFKGLKLPVLKPKELERHLQKDKKKEKQKINFVFPGLTEPPRVQKVSIEQILNEYKRQSL